MIKFRKISGFQIFPDDDRLETSIKKIRCPFDLKLWRVEPYNWNLVSVHSYKEYLRFFDFVLRGELFSTPMGLKLHFVLYLKAIEYIFECRDSQTDQFELVRDFQYLIWSSTSFGILRIIENAYFDCKTLLWRLCLVSYDSNGFGQLPLWLVLFEETFGFDRIFGVKSEWSF